MSQAASEPANPSLLTVNDIEVIYDGAILAVAGVSLHVPKGAIVALLGANGAGKSTTLKAISGLVRAERAEVSRGVIEYAGQDLAGIDPSQRVRQGMVHVLEGRHVFGQLTVEDNLRSGGFVRRLSRKAMEQDLERIYSWFPRLKTKRHTRAGLTSGGVAEVVGGRICNGGRTNGRQGLQLGNDARELAVLAVVARCSCGSVTENDDRKTLLDRKSVV